MEGSKHYSNGMDLSINSRNFTRDYSNSSESLTLFKAKARGYLESFLELFISKRQQITYGSVLLTRHSKTI